VGRGGSWRNSITPMVRLEAADQGVETRERECVESHVGLFSSSGVVVSGRRCGVL